MEIIETLLPGVGVRYEMETAGGRQLGLVVRRGGGAQLCSYDRHDPDRATDRVELAPEEATALADLLGATRLTQRFADLSHEVPGLDAARLALRPGSRYDGRTLGDTRARTRTGASVVAVVRGDEVVASPPPDHLLRGNDVVVAIGSEDSLVELAKILERQPD